MATPNLKQYQAKEILRCGKDPSYFFNKYVKIQHPMRGSIPFKTFDFQDDCIKDFLKNRFTICLKARQLGLSTVTAGYALWMILFRENVNILVIATKLSTAKNFISKCKYMLKCLPPWLVLCNINKQTVQEIGTSRGSTLKAIPTSEDAGRSEALSLLIVDEAAFVRDFDDLWKGLYPTLSTGGRAILLSCVVEDTWVYTKGGPTQIRNFIKSDKIGGYEIDEYSILGKDNLRKGSLFHNNGFVKTKKIITKHSWIEGSENHKLWSCVDGEYGWNRLDELKENDFIAYQYGQNVWGNNDDISDFLYFFSNKEKNKYQPPKTITKDLSYYFGIFLAEGSNYESKNKNGDIVGNSNILTCGDDLANVFKCNASCHDGMHYSLSSKSFGNFLKYIGFNLDLHAPEKIIPSRLLQMSSENIASLLRGLFDGDGYSRSDRGTIGISLSSKLLIEQIRILLNNFGIITDYYEGVTPPTKKVKVSSKYFRIEINGRNSKIFYEKIGFNFKRKQNNLNELKYNFDVKNTKDIIPNSLSLIKEMYAHSSKNLCDLKRDYGIFMNCILNTKTPYKTNDISRDLCLVFYNAVKDEIPEQLRIQASRIIGRNIKWDRVSFIKNGYSQTYDFSLPDNEEDFWCHSVIYNGLLGHQTPNGTGNKFFEIYDKAEKGENRFHPIKLPWHVHPERDETWFKLETANMSKKDIAQELECDFAASGDTFLDSDIIERIRLNVIPPVRRVGEDRNIWIWHDPSPDHKYILAADTARGDGKDYSTFHIIDATEGRISAEYQGKLPPDRFADIINEFGLLYNKALVCPENNNVGYATVQRLCFLQYPRIYNNKEKTLDIWGSDGNDGNLQKPSGDLGLFTNGGNRNVLLTKLEEFLRNESIEIYSSRLHKELKTFVWLTNNKVAAEKNRNDDLVMALAIGFWLLDTSDFTRYSEEHSLALIDAMTQSSSNLDDIIDSKIGRKQDDYSILLPVAAGGGAGGLSKMSGKTTRAQILNNKWNWLIS